MHETAMANMQWFADTYLREKNLRVLDVGSLNINGNYRKIIEDMGHTYIGLDIFLGSNVDVCVADPYNWTELEDESFDAVISGNTFEHIQFPDKTMKEINRVVKRGGYVCVVAPSSGGIHQEILQTRPTRIMIDDYRRYDAETARQLIADGQLEEIFVGTRIPSIWNDMVIIAKKPDGRTKKKRGWDVEIELGER